MDPDSIIEVVKGLADLADPALTHVYATYLRQAYISGAGRLLLGLVMGLLTLPAWAFRHHILREHLSGDCPTYRVHKGYGQEPRDECDCSAFTMGILVGAGVVCLVAVAIIYSGVSELANPHYYAIHSLIRSVRGRG